MIILPFSRKRHRKHGMCSACKTGEHHSCNHMGKCCCGKSMHRSTYFAEKYRERFSDASWSHMLEHLPLHRFVEMFPWLHIEHEDHGQHCPACAKGKHDKCERHCAEHVHDEHKFEHKHDKHDAEHKHEGLGWNKWKPNLAILIVILITSGRFSALLRRIKP